VGRPDIDFKYAPAYLRRMSGTDKKFIETVVGDVYESIVKGPSTVKKDSKVNEVIESMLQNPLSRKVYVVDADGKLLGMVNTETVLRLIGYRVGVREYGGLSFYRFLRDMFKESVGGLVSPTRSVTRDTKLTEALDIMIQEHVNDLPVVEPDGRLIGELVSLELFLKGKDLFNKEENA
jgi:CBS domain-containing protein